MSGREIREQKKVFPSPQVIDPEEAAAEQARKLDTQEAYKKLKDFQWAQASKENDPQSAEKIAKLRAEIWSLVNKKSVRLGDIRELAKNEEKEEVGRLTRQGRKDDAAKIGKDLKHFLRFLDVCIRSKIFKSRRAMTKEPIVNFQENDKPSRKDKPSSVEVGNRKENRNTDIKPRVLGFSATEGSDNIKKSHKSKSHNSKYDPKFLSQRKPSSHHVVTRASFLEPSSPPIK